MRFWWHTAGARGAHHIVFSVELSVVVTHHLQLEHAIMAIEEQIAGLSKAIVDLNRRLDQLVSAGILAKSGAAAAPAPAPAAAEPAPAKVSAYQAPGPWPSLGACTPSASQSLRARRLPASRSAACDVPLVCTLRRGIQ